MTMHIFKLDDGLWHAGHKTSVCGKPTIPYVECTRIGTLDSKELPTPKWQELCPVCFKSNTKRPV